MLPESTPAARLHDRDPAEPGRPSAGPGRPARPGTALAVGVGLAILAGVVLRFIAPPSLWLDEAQSVAIARLPVPRLFDALRQDGSPPLYYLVLHGWMAVFGTGGVAVRALSGVFGVASLGVAWALGSRLGGRRVGTVLTLLLASSPFAIRYSSETRMYSLIVLLVLLGAAAVSWAVRRPGPRPVVAVAGCGAALLLTHYWAAYLLAVTGLLCLLGLRRYRREATRVLVGLVLAGLLFLPWLPALRWQTAHTGTPWAHAGGLTSITTALGGWQGGGSVPAVLLGDAFVVLAVLALAAVPDRTGVRLGVSRSPARWALLALSLGTLVVGGLASLPTSSAVIARYTSVALPAFLALVAVGVAGLPGRRTRTAVSALCVVAGLSLAADGVTVPRTQAADVATALGTALPGDTVVFCPDQLGPSVSRLAPAGLDLVGYPGLRPAGRVDWTDYAQRNEGADPDLVAARVSARAGNHAVYVVTTRGSRVPSDADCAQLRTALGQLRGRPVEVVRLNPTVSEAMRVHRFPPPPTSAP